MDLKTIRIQRVVEKQNLASVMKSGSLDVLATPQMIAWMEEAACLCLELEEGKTSVGISMNVSHDMASPLGATITIEAKMVAKLIMKYKRSKMVNQLEKVYTVVLWLMHKNLSIKHTRNKKRNPC